MDAAGIIGSVELTTEAPFAVHVAADAAARITDRGGRLFLWNRAVGKIGLRDHMSFSPPPDVEFECYEHAKSAPLLW